MQGGLLSEHLQREYSDVKDKIEAYVDIVTNVKLAIYSKDFSALPGLIEQWQSLGNAVESALYDKKDIEYYREELKDLKKEVKKLKAEKKELRDD